VLFYTSLAVLIAAVALINWMAKAPPEGLAPRARRGLMGGALLVAVVATFLIIYSVESGNG